jgi:hypothetical protein
MPHWPRRERKKMIKSFDLITDHFQFMVGDAGLGPLEDTSCLWDNPKTIVQTDSQMLIAIQTDEYSEALRITFARPPCPVEIVDGFISIGKFTLSVPSKSVSVWAPETEDASALSSFYVGAEKVIGEVYFSATASDTPQYLFKLEHDSVA